MRGWIKDEKKLMANVWVKNRCAVCGEPVEKKGILVAQVNVTSNNAYQCYSSKDNEVRPNFRPKGLRVLYHEDCYEGMGKP